jgi:hypothetical protein
MCIPHIHIFLAKLHRKKVMKHHLSLSRQKKKRRRSDEGKKAKNKKKMRKKLFRNNNTESEKNKVRERHEIIITEHRKTLQSQNI